MTYIWHDATAAYRAHVLQRIYTIFDGNHTYKKDPPSCLSSYYYFYQALSSSFRRMYYSMCDYTKVSYECGHVRYLVKAWCVRYQQTQQRCPPNVVATETRPMEKCGDCKGGPSK